MKDTVNILGTEYKVFFREEKDEPKLKNADGYIDHSIKDLKSYSKKVLRHEVIHGFLYESGLWNNSGNVEAWGRSEEITDWIAIQFPKMLKAFQEVGCL